MKKQLWIILALIVIIALLYCGAAMAEVTTGQCGDNVHWSFDSATGVVTVTGSGPMWDYDWKSNKSPFDADETVTSAAIGEGVTSIGADFFVECHNLTSVSLPSTLQCIGIGAFYKNHSITSLTLPDSVTVLGAESFAYCTGLIDVTLSEGLTEIPRLVFAYCSSLTDVTIPASVISIASEAFFGCPNITTIHGVPGSYAETYAAARGCAFFSTVPATASGTCGIGVNWTLHDDGALDISGEGSMDSYSTTAHAPWYNNRFSITSVIVRDGVTSIGAYAFYNCDNLTNVTVYGFSTTFGSNVFTGCPAELTLHGYEDSPAEAYATSNSIAFEGWPSGENGQCGDDVTWRLDYITGAVTVTGTGPMWNYRPSSSPSPLEWNKMVTSVVIGEGVNTVGAWFFYECYNLTSVSLPSTLQSIEEGAFFDNDLGSLTIPDGVTHIGKSAFRGNDSITSLTLPDSVTELGVALFSDCIGLTHVVLSEALTEIPSQAFYYCSALTDVTIPACVKSIASDAFDHCSSLTTIHGVPGSYAETYAAAMGYAFFSTVPVTASGSCGAGVNWTLHDDGMLMIFGNGSMDSYSTSSRAPWYDIRSSITSLTIHNGVTSVGSYAFYYCYNLTRVTIPASVTSVGISAYQACTHLTELSIAAGVKSLGDSVFRQCTNLASVVIPRTVNNISSHAFSGCSSLIDVTISSPTATFGNDVFSGCPAGLTLRGYEGSTVETYASGHGLAFEGIVGSCGEGLTWKMNYATNVLTISGSGVMTDYTIGESPWYEIREDITTIVISNGAESIGKHAFDGCINVTGVTIPSSVTSISSFAFSNCSGLTAITIQDGVLLIYENAFSGCTGLTDVTIPASVTEIRFWTFRDCSSLSSVTILNPDAGIGDDDYDVFENCPSTLILCGWYGSTAEIYANAAGITFQAIPNGSCGDHVTWTLKGETMFIRGTGPMDDFIGYAAIPWYTYRNSVTSVVIEGGVTSVGKWAFGNLPALENVTIADSVTSIGDFAFYHCNTLQGITIPDSVQTVGAYAFDSCTAMTTVHLGSGVTSLGTYTFYDCASVTAFTVDENNTSYSAEDGVLFNKTKATLINYPNGKTETSYTVPDSVRMISPVAFLNNKTLETVHLNSKLKTIQSFAFLGCTALKSMLIPASVTDIKQNCFDGCTTLTSVTIMNPNMTFSANNIFNGCTALTLYGFAGSTAETYAAANGIPFKPTGGSCGDALTWLFMDDTLTISGTGTMNNYTGGNQPWNAFLANVTTIVVETGVTGIGNNAFEYAECLTSVSLPDSLTSLGDNAFTGCSALNAVTIPGGVQSICMSAFEGCSTLSSLTIQEGVASIGDYAFENCISLTELILPQSMVSVGYAAFFGDTGLTSVKVQNKTAVIDDTAFYGCNNLTLRGYSGSTAEAFATEKGIPFVPLTVDNPTLFLPDSLTMINSEAFSGIAAKGVVIPNAVTTIAPDAFLGSQVTTIYGYADSAAEAFCASHIEFTFVEIDDAWMASH